MKIRLTFKGPDALSGAIQDAGIERELPDGEYNPAYDDLYGEIAEWVRYGEYLDAEYDTETKQMTVLKK